MKKIMALLLVFALCLSLCACGKAEDYESALALMDAGNYEEAIAAFAELGDYEDSIQKLEACENTLAYADATALFEDEAYEDALVIFSTLGDYKDSASKKLDCENAIAYDEAVSLIEAGKYEEARLIFETISDYKDASDYLGRYKTIEITQENWRNYFAIIMVPYFDTFDRLEEILYKFVLNDKYKNIAVYGSGFSIDIAYKGIGTTATVEYNKENDTFVFGPALPGWGGQVFYDWVLTFTDTDFAQMVMNREDMINNGEIRRMCTLVNDYITHEEAGDGCNSMEHNIDNIKGTIVIYGSGSGEEEDIPETTDVPTETTQPTIAEEEVGALHTPYVGKWVCSNGDTVIINEDGTLIFNDAEYTPEYFELYGGVAVQLQDVGEVFVWGLTDRLGEGVMGADRDGRQFILQVD